MVACGSVAEVRPGVQNLILQFKQFNIAGRLTYIFSPIAFALFVWMLWHINVKGPYTTLGYAHIG